MSELKEWTLMFYFASDNDLAPIVVSQLKAIKDAGFQENVDVLVHFDPNEFGVPTRLYDVNRERKRKKRGQHKTMIGDGKDPFVRNMSEDDVRPDAIVARAGSQSAVLLQALLNPDSINAEEELGSFLGFCRENHKARHYMLFLVGHGMVVGNDAFLPDDNPISAITLKKLGEILKGFSDKVKDEGSVFELLALHSCSLSAIEVAYELKGTAKYMMAAEGPAFVNGWPYRQLLKKIFNNLEKVRRSEQKSAKGRRRRRGGAEKGLPIDVDDLVERLYFLTLFNATDFLLAGYSHDLALCRLNEEEKFGPITAAIQQLVARLKQGLAQSKGKKGTPATERGNRIKELVLLSHWEAQSYWEENYTDLLDFCRCLRERCGQKNDLKDLRDACSEVMDKLTEIIIHSDNFGATSQYSHGLAVYFPWARPVEIVPKRGTTRRKKGAEKYADENKPVLERYAEYAFTEELQKSGGNSWLSFLDSYFKETMRPSRIEEDKAVGRAVRSRPKAFAIARSNFDPLGELSNLNFTLKTSPKTGPDCSCPSIKNYPQETKDKGPEEAQGKIIKNADSFAISKGALQAFKTESK